VEGSHVMTSDGVFQILSIVVLLIVLGGMAAHFLVAGRKRRAASPAGGAADLRRYGRLERLACVVAVLCFVALAVSGFIPGLILGARLEGWLLMLHVMAGGAFSVCLGALAVLWADDCRFEPHDETWCRTCCRAGEKPIEAARFDAGQKAAFWAGLALGASTILTMMVSMLPWFGPEGLDVLRDVHRYCALAFLAVALLHCYRTMTVRRGRWSWLIRGKVSSEWAQYYHPIWWQAVKGKEAK
jgi:cytochrome b subunit of formate dehydrogenase